MEEFKDLGIDSLEYQLTQAHQELLEEMQSNNSNANAIEHAAGQSSKALGESEDRLEEPSLLESDFQKMVRQKLN